MGSLSLLLLLTAFSGFVFAQPPPRPNARFHTWDQLCGNEQAAATVLGYSVPSWEYELGAVNPNTAKAYSTLVSENANFILNFVNIGLSEWQWDCYVNGYEDYFWCTYYEFLLFDHCDAF